MTVFFVHLNLQINSTLPTHPFSKYGSIPLRLKIMDFYIR